jgi:chromate transport protein ChrA
MFVSIAITLQVVGFVIWDRNTNTGLCVAFSGGCLFHTFAMVVFSYLLYKHKELRHRKILFTALVYVLCAAASYSLKFVDDSDTFLQVS